LQNATPKERTLFLEAVYKHYDHQNLFERMKKLREKKIINGVRQRLKNTRNVTNSI
jgi:hypothetical protein